MRATSWIVIAIVLYGIIGDLYFRSFFHLLWIILTVLFVLFLIVHGWMDHKGKFMPGYKSKKHDKEG